MNDPMIEIIERPRPCMLDLGIFPNGLECAAWCPIESIDGEPIASEDQWCALCGADEDQHPGPDDDDGC